MDVVAHDNQQPVYDLEELCDLLSTQSRTTPSSHTRQPSPPSRSMCYRQIARGLILTEVLRNLTLPPR